MTDRSNNLPSGRGIFQAGRRLVHGIAVVHVPPALQQRLCLEQATDLTYVMRGISVIGINTIALLFFDFLRNGAQIPAVVATCCLLGVYAAIIWRGGKWLGGDKTSGQAAKKSIDAILPLCAGLGLGWAILIISLTRTANPDQAAVLSGVIVGCMATPVMVAPMSCAIAYWFPLTVGAIASLFVRPAIDPFAVICLLGFASLTGFCIVYLNKRLAERLISAIRVEEHSEVIKLLLRDFEESASDWLWETNADLDLRRVSPRLAEVARKTQDSLTGRFPQALLGDITHADQRAGSPIGRLNRYLAERSAFRDLVIPVVIGGEERSWSLTGKPILDKAGNFIGYHGVGSDITSARRSQEQISFLARHDSLTKLPNRVLFNEVLHQACQRCDHEGLALLCLDLDDFKLVNDSLGHATGDGVLVAVGERIRGCIRDSDTASRLGGDEFAIILTFNDPEEVAIVARRLVERISRPYHFDGRLVEIGISIGISLAPRDTNVPNGLLKNADLALYRAKAEGRGTWRFYDSEMDERLQDRRALQQDLRQALVREEFSLDYQPIIDLAANRVVAAEALLRWYHPERGLLSPIEFIPLAEEAGLIAPIGAWVLREACFAAVKWPGDIRIAVNLSPVQFRDPGVVETVDRALSESGLDPSRLELEITETTVLETNSATVDALWKLHGRGVRIALDDFGTGYSSLSYLRRFPFDKIKIDRSFIRDLGHEKDDSSIILAIIGLADSMNMVVTAEGVETTQQAALLTSYGCAQAQGFLFCRPVHADHIAALIAETDLAIRADVFPTAAQ